MWNNGISDARVIIECKEATSEIDVRARAKHELQNTTKMKYLLVGSEVSLFTGKIRAYLRYKGIPFEEVLATNKVYKELIIPKTGAKIIPILIDLETESVFQDTKEIIAEIESKHPEPRIIPSDHTLSFVSNILELYADEWLVLPAMYYRWGFEQQKPYLYYEFGRTNSPDTSLDKIMKAGKRVARPFEGALPSLGIHPETYGAVVSQFRELMGLLSTHLQSVPYLLGYKPSLADFAFSGPLYAHLFRDPIPSQIIKFEFPLVADYIERVQGLVPSRSASNRITGVHFADTTGDIHITRESHHQNGQEGFLLKETLFPILHLFFRDQLPILLDTFVAVKDFISSKIREDPSIIQSQEPLELPRTIGTHLIQLYERSPDDHQPSLTPPVTRRIFPYVLWMVQRIVDKYERHHIDPTFWESMSKYIHSLETKTSGVSTARGNLVIEPLTNYESLGKTGGVKMVWESLVNMFETENIRVWKEVGRPDLRVMVGVHQIERAKL